MREMMQDSSNYPPPLPSGLDAPVPMMDGVAGPALVHDTSSGLPAPTTDRLAIASSVCGLTAFVPVVSQLIGLALGVLAVLRIRRARVLGKLVRGNGWAAAGIAWNGFVLLGWIALFGAFSVLKTSMTDSNDAFRKLLQTPPMKHVRSR